MVLFIHIEKKNHAFPVTGYEFVFLAERSTLYISVHLQIGA